MTNKYLYPLEHLTFWIENLPLSFPAWIEGDITYNKKINKTNVISGNGAIIEDTGREPLEFVIGFHLVGKDRSDYETQLNKLKSIVEKREPVAIVFEEINLWGVYQIYIENLSYTPSENYIENGSIDCVEYSNLFFLSLSPPTQEIDFLDNLSNITLLARIASLLSKIL